MKGVVVEVLMFQCDFYCRRTEDTLMSSRDQGGWRLKLLTLTPVPCILCLAVSYHGIARRLDGNEGVLGRSEGCISVALVCKITGSCS
jgi:hypothetical protein